MTPLALINLGLGKIGQSRINNINPPKTQTERTAAEGYAQWRDSELRKRRWVFATRSLVLSRTTTPKLDGVRQAFEFDVPKTVLRVVRLKRSQWVMRGRLLYSPYETETVEAIVSVPEDDFDPSFNEVLSCRCAKELVEPVTQSNEKWQKAQTVYKEAIDDAARLNAFLLEEHTLTANDEDSSWVAARFDGMVLLEDDGD